MKRAKSLTSKARITTKQRAARKRNIAIARASKKTASPKMRIVSQGKGEMKEFRLISSDGSSMHDMSFSSKSMASAYARKRGIKLSR